METLQPWFSHAGYDRDYLMSCLPLFKSEELLTPSVCLLHALPPPYACLGDQSLRMQNDKKITKQRKLKWNINRPTQWKVLTVYTFTGLVYMLQRKKHPPTTIPAAKHQTHSKLRVSRIRKKTCNLPDATLDPAITLLV